MSCAHLYLFSRLDASSSLKAIYLHLGPIYIVQYEIRTKRKYENRRWVLINTSRQLSRNLEWTQVLFFQDSVQRVQNATLLPANTLSDLIRLATKFTFYIFRITFEPQM